MQSFGAGIIHLVGPPQISRCLVVIRRLSWCSASLSPASPLTLQVSFIEPAVIYCTLVFLLAPAIRHRVSDRLKLEVRTFHVYAHAGTREQSASLIGGHYQRRLAFRGRRNTGELPAFFFFFYKVRGLWRLCGQSSGLRM